MTVIPSAPLLSNHPDSLGKEQETPFGTFQVNWEAGIDSHVLLYRSSGYPGNKYGPRVLCCHNNGHCLQEVIERVRQGDVSRIISQVRYIRDCGGMSCNDSTFENCFSSDEHATA